MFYRGNMEMQEAAGIRVNVLNRDVIKYMAMFTMLLNHIAHMFLVKGTLLYELFVDIGYFTAPVMCYFIVEGYDYTRSKTKYGIRLLVFAVISQIPFTLAFQFGNLNMIYTLLCCFLILVVMERITNSIWKRVICMLLVFATVIGDWPLLAPIYTILLHNSKGNRKKIAISYGIAYILFVLLNFMGYIFGTQVSITGTVILHQMLSGTGIIAAAIVVLVFYNGERSRKGRNFSKWFFYIFYPAHLMILYLIKTYVLVV